MEDVLPGNQQEQQSRGGQTVTINSLDVPFTVNQLVDLQQLDVAKYTYARLYGSSILDSVDYKFDSAATIGIQSTTSANGRWVPINQEIKALIKYDGADWVVDTNVSSSTIVDADCNWLVDGSGGRLIVDFTAAYKQKAPVALVSTVDDLSGNNLLPKVAILSDQQVAISFFDFTGSRVTTEATTMQVLLTVL